MSTWHKASDPPLILEDCQVSDDIIIYNDFCEYSLGCYYCGKDGKFYISGANWPAV